MSVPGLRYNGLSLVYLQIFTVDDFDHTRLPAKYFKFDPDSIDRQIFHTDTLPEELVRRYKIAPSFDFSLRIREDENEVHGYDPDPVTIGGTIHVEMSVFLNRTVSLSYRMMIDGQTCRADRPLDTDEVICLAAQSVGTEHWNTRTEVDTQGREFSDSRIDADLVEFTIDDFHFDADGNYIEKGEKIAGRNRYFAEVLHRYKMLVLSSQPPQPEALKRSREMNYVYVDVWENISHSEELFKKQRFSDSAIIGHIEHEHRRELVGLMSFYPYEWEYRSPDAFPDVCGGNIAIDTDDLVLVNQNICVVFGTYQNRVEWKDNIEQRKNWHVSWPEYLMILEMVLAQKYTISVIADRYLDSTPGIASLRNTRRVIENNALELVRATELMMRLDAIKYSRYISHKIMFERTRARLDVEKESARLREMIEQIDKCLFNLSEMRTLGQSKILNVVLGIVSVAALFEILFQKVELPFLSKLSVHTFAGHISLTLILLTVAVVLVAPVVLIAMSIRNNRIRR
jgi:hypothetical protein